MTKGGMQTSGVHYTIYCEKCGKPAFKKEFVGSEIFYYHFTKTGTIVHTAQVALVYGVG